MRNSRNRRGELISSHSPSRKTPRLPLGDRLRRLPHPLQFGETPPRLAQEALAGGGEADDTLPVPDQQIEPDLLLQRRDLGGYGGLGDPEPRRGAVQVQLLGDHHEILQPVEIHLPSITSEQRQLIK